MYQPHPRTMHDFFAKSQGTWHTQREVHHLDNVADESGESLLLVQPIDTTDPNTTAICQNQGIPRHLASGGARFLWQTSLDAEPPDPNSGAILIDLPNPQDPQSGKLLRDRGYVEKIPVISRYWFAQDGILTITTEYENSQGQERCWFITHNIRIRVSNVRLATGVQLLTYCTERRIPSTADLDTLIQNNKVRTNTL